MTAEIAVLNRSAVALAADSAVTIQLPEGPKIYETNKLFTLSKYRPVGVMVYGSANFMGVPWETIIKQYRAGLGNQSFGRLEQYGTSLLRFVERHSGFFPRAQQRNYCRHLTRSWLRHLRHQLNQNVEQRFKQGPVPEARIRSIFRQIVREDVKRLRAHGSLERFSRTTPVSLLRRCRNEINRAIRDELQQLAPAVPLRELQLGCALAIIRQCYWHGESGVVVAGFGQGEFFPALRCYTLDAIIDGKLRAAEVVRRRRQITPSGVSASVMAFAQSEMVTLFMDGIDGEYSEFLRSFVSELLLKGYPSLIEQALGASVAASRRLKVVGRVRKIGQRLAAALESRLTEYSRTRHSDPIVDIVDVLPKEELAAMAEALVNLTSFKRHVARQAETVGGPIDVAVISRGDGFVWIKRKHYFSPQLNPHFLANYFRNDGR